MQNGLFERESGDFWEVECRKELESERLQAVLRRNHHRAANLGCGCGLEDGRHLPVVPVLRDDLFGAARGEISEHRLGCFLTGAGDGLPIEQLRAAGILASIGAATPASGSSAVGQRAQSRAAYETFSTYARSVFSLGLSRAFIRKNRGAAELKNPTTAEVFLGIDHAVRQLPFTNGLNGYEAAIRQQHRLRVGLVFDPLVLNQRPTNAISAFWWSERRMRLEHAQVAAEAMRPAVADLQILSHHQAPPYFALAVQDVECCLQRIYLHQVAVEEDFMMPAESGAEAHYATELVRRGAAVIKTMRTADAQTTLSALGISVPQGFPYRPDFLIPWRSRSGLTLQMRELRGFRLGSNADYDRLMQRRHVVSSSMGCSVPVNYLEVDGTNFRWSAPSTGPESWPNTEVVMDSPGTDLLG